ncbi:MAG TPA: T9SS type A sorting domain-containing protein, partial [Chitinophagales bacterium]|nr:T9SS type A sorting domain-containing protein [Chitinophagales bacterium]
SSVYSPYCLTGLLNLVDFAQDAEIKNLATIAAQRLLKDLLKLTTDQGVFFPTAGRNYYGKYQSAWGQNHSNLIYLLTGLGQAPTNASHAGGFLASSTLEIDSVADSWAPVIDTSYYNGMPLDTLLTIDTVLRPIDKVILQWSAGAYFHPEVAYETDLLLTDSSLWNHTDFAPFRSLQSVPASGAVDLANQLSALSKSSVISGDTIVIFKHNSVSLSSVRDFWKGKVGYQEFPCAATVGSTAVLTASGPIDSTWNHRSAENANEDLPYVGQHKNVALLMYRPETVPAFLGYNHKEVALYWNQPDFDEQTTDSNWIIGRQGGNYVAVRRSCTDSISHIIACDIMPGQSWVIVVGDSGMYGNFSNFQSLVHQSQFTENWYLDSVNQQYVYYAKIVFDTTTIDYAWGVDSSTTTAIKQIVANPELSVYPNPANNTINIQMPELAGQHVNIAIANLLGQQLYNTNKTVVGTETIDVSTLPEGAYVITVRNGQSLYTAKLIKRE